MNSALQKIRARRVLRQQRSLQDWEEIRAEGKARFVRRTALTYGLTMVGVTDVIQRGFYGEAEPLLLLKVIVFVIFGIVGASCNWSTMEAKREDALRKASANALPNNQTLTQSGQGVSKA